MEIEKIKIDLECSKEYLKEDREGKVMIPVTQSRLPFNKGSIIFAGNQLDYLRIQVVEIETINNLSYVVGRINIERM